MHTWNDLLELARREPALREFIMLHVTGRLTQEQALIEAVYWYAQALRSTRAQLVDAIALQPRIYVLDGK